MASQYRHRRTSNPAQAFPALLEPGEIAVNTANRQLALGDANATTLGAPLPVLAVRFFDVRGQYASGDIVVQNGIVYRANGNVPPGAFNAANWTALADPAAYVNVSGDTMTGPLTLPGNPTGNLEAVPKQYADLKVAKAGDTMTGNLIIDKTLPALTFDKAGPGDSTSINGTSGGVGRWTLSLGDSAPETGGNIGSDFVLSGYTDAGTLLPLTALRIERAEGTATFTGPLIAQGNLTVKENSPTATAGQINFSNTANRYLRFDGTNYHFANGNLLLDQGELHLNPTGTTGAIRFGNLSSRFLWYDGSSYQLSGGHLITSEGGGVNAHDITARGGLNVATQAFIGGNIISTTGYVACRGNAYVDALNSTNSPSYVLRSEGGVNLGGIYLDRPLDEIRVTHTASGVSLRVSSWGIASTHNDCYKPTGGPWVTGSDARIKTVHGDYTNGLAAVLALHPVIYSYKGNDSFGLVEQGAPTNTSSVAGKPFIGIVAQECETAMPEMVAKVPGYIDGEPVTDLRTLDTGPLIYALVNAVKELTARIEALENA